MILKKIFCFILNTKMVLKINLQFFLVSLQLPQKAARILTMAGTVAHKTSNNNYFYYNNTNTNHGHNKVGM